MTAAASLPFGAREKFRALSDSEIEAQALVSATMRSISELSKALDLNPNGDDAANIEHELTRLRGKLGEQQTRHHVRSNLNAQIRFWLSAIPPNASLEAAKPVKAKLKAGENLASGVDRLREEIGALRNERRKVEQAGLPIADAKAAAQAYVDGLTARGRPRIVAEHEKFTVTFEAMVEGAYTPTPDLAAALAWLDPKAFAQRLMHELDAAPKPALALSKKAKADKLAMIAAKLAALEYEEEAMIAESEVEGPALARRPDASPAAILGVIVSLRKAATSAA
jgi:hypothetical protein